MRARDVRNCLWPTPHIGDEQPSTCQTQQQPHSLYTLSDSNQTFHIWSFCHFKSREDCMGSNLKRVYRRGCCGLEIRVVVGYFRWHDVPGRRKSHEGRRAPSCQFVARSSARPLSLASALCAL